MIPAGQQNPFNIDGSCSNDKPVYFLFYTLRPQQNDRHFEDISNAYHWTRCFLFWQYIINGSGNGVIWEHRSKMGFGDFSPHFSHVKVNNAHCVANGTAMHIFKTRHRAVNMPLHQDNYTCSRSHPSLFTWCWHFPSQRILCRQMIHRGRSILTRFH